ncbi:glycosyltransferase [Candidatus Gottesmanbacteria bacterium]|nr:glycosyltransferase [Candidatus Gottesmanbacteria bacterium]
MKKVKNHFLSIVIPAYRQEKTIARDLRRIRNVLEKIRYDYEIVVVTDGKEDRTFDNAQKVASQKIKVVGYEKNHGKGYAIRYGMARTKGDVVAFIDAGMDLDPNGLSMLLEHFEWYDADIIVGSKRHSVSQVDYPWQRKILSFGYQLLVRLLFGLNIRDTQVGMKFFKRKVLEDVLPRLLVKQYAFDIEILAVARRLGFKRIFEAPIRLQWDQGRSIISKSLWKILLNMLKDTLAVFYRLKILRYYDEGNKRKWRYDPDLNFKVNIG